MMVYVIREERATGEASMLDTKIRIFRMAATLCNFTRAAAALGMTQSNVTGQIRRLEEELGAELFCRDGRRIELTAAGKVLFREAELLAGEEERALRLVRNATGGVPGFELGATMTAGGYVLPKLAAAYMREHAGKLRLNLRIANTAEISERLKRNFYDLALVEGPFDDRFFLSQKLMDDELFLAGSSRLPLLRRERPELEELFRSGVPILLRERGAGTRFYFEQFCRSRGVELDGMPQVLTVNNFDAIRNMLSDGFGVTVISRLALGAELESGLLAARRFAEGEIRRSLNFIYLAGEALRFAEEFIAFCRLRIREGDRGFSA